MGKDNAAKQRAAEKRKRRELEMRKKKTEAKRPAQPAPSQKALTIQDLPIVECVNSRGWEESGLSHLLLVRRFPDDNVLVAGYFVDTFCLGIKDCALLERMSESDYRTNIKPSIFNDPVEFVDIDPSMAMGIAEGAAEFAAKFGFKPNKRWSEARKMFEGIEPPANPPSFGKNGKPCYVKRDETNQAAILAKLERAAGTGGYTVEDAPE